jgi:phosphopantothenate-cysteine ligase
MESQFKPSGWLGALMGTRLYFDMSGTDKISTRSIALVKELGNMGK